VRHFSFKINSLSLSLLAAHFAAERFLPRTILIFVPVLM
jgi:hypothetical protein